MGTHGIQHRHCSTADCGRRTFDHYRKCARAGGAEARAVLGWVLAAVAGIMVSISMDELAPAAKSFGSEHAPIIGVIVGMVIMALSLWLLK